MPLHFIVKGKSRNPAPILIRFVHGRNTDISIRSRQTVNPKDWSNKTESLRQRLLNKDDKKLLDNLKGIKDLIESEARFHTGTKSKEWLESVLNKFYNIKTDQSNTMSGFISNFISQAESGEIKNRHGKNYAKGTLTNYKSFQTAFNEYQGIYTEERLQEFAKKEKQPRPRKIIDFEDVTVDFYNSFVAYLSNEGYAINTMDKHISSLKYFMAKSLSQKKHRNREFQESAFGGFSEEGHAIYLTQDEIEKIYRADLSDYSEGHGKARDIFIVLCETALRISDYDKVSMSVKKISGVKMIEVYMKKTESRVFIPLTHRMKHLLQKYNDHLPVVSDVTTNEYIKNIARDCKINEVISWPAQKYGKKYTASAPKWKLITCHTGRRSAATNMYLAGIPVLDIMRIGGWKTEKSFLRYIRISQEETARKLADHPYFKMKVV